MEKITTAVLMGGNLGDVEDTFRRAIDLLSQKGYSITATSSLYRTPPWGFSSDQDFLNAVILLADVQYPIDLMKDLLAIEQQLGRLRNEKATGYESRTIDLDLLFHGQTVLEHPDLILPHPRMHQRAFTLVPLLEVHGDWYHPVLDRWLTECLQEISAADVNAIQKAG